MRIESAISEYIDSVTCLQQSSTSVNYFLIVDELVKNTKSKTGKALLFAQRGQCY